MIIETSLETSYLGWRTSCIREILALHPSPFMHVCEQSYATDLAQLQYNCELLFTSVELKLRVIESALKLCLLMDKYCNYDIM